MSGKKQQWKKQTNDFDSLFWGQTASLSYFAQSMPQVCPTPQNWVSGWNGNVNFVQNNEVSMHWKIFLPISWRNLKCWGLQHWQSLGEKKRSVSDTNWASASPGRIWQSARLEVGRSWPSQWGPNVPLPYLRKEDLSQPLPPKRAHLRET